MDVVVSAHRRRTENDARNAVEEAAMHGGVMKDLWVMLYRSVEAYEMDTADMLKLLLDARSYNIHSDITGLLLHHEGCFMQVLEGPREQVRALYDRIVVDPRHRDVVLEWDAAVDERLFPDWQMGFAEVPNIRGRAVMAGVESEYQAMQVLRALTERHVPAKRMLDFLIGGAPHDAARV
jgi:Sensors of blue-light using FAD